MGNNIFKKKKQTPLHHVEVGGFVCNWYFKHDSIVDSYMEIRTVSGNWSMKLDARHEVYGYLMVACEQGLTEQVHGYCVTLYLVATQMTQDQGFVNDVQKAITKYMKRMDKKAENEAESVSEAQIAGDEALMQEAIERGELRGDKKAEKRASKESREEIRKILEEEAKADTENHKGKSDGK